MAAEGSRPAPRNLPEKHGGQHLLPQKKRSWAELGEGLIALRREQDAAMIFSLIVFHCDNLVKLVE
jgi:hypothetical protein